MTSQVASGPCDGGPRPLAWKLTNFDGFRPACALQDVAVVQVCAPEDSLDFADAAAAGGLS
jgi:hypothetical protein